MIVHYGTKDVNFFERLRLLGFMDLYIKEGRLLIFISFLEVFVNRGGAVLSIILKIN